MHQTKKGNQWHFGMKVHVPMDADSDMVHTVRGTAPNVNYVVKGNSSLHDEETGLFADAGYQGAHNRPDTHEATTSHGAMRPGKRKQLDKTFTCSNCYLIKRNGRATLARMLTLVRYRGVVKNRAPLKTLFALANLWIVRRKRGVLDGQLRPKVAVAA